MFSFSVEDAVYRPHRRKEEIDRSTAPEREYAYIAPPSFSRTPGVLGNLESCADCSEGHVIGIPIDRLVSGGHTLPQEMFHVPSDPSFQCQATEI